MPHTRFRVNLQSIVGRDSIKELLTRNRHDIWSLSDSNGIRTHNLFEVNMIWPVWLNGWVFVYELNICGFEFRCCHLNCSFVFQESQIKNKADEITQLCWKLYSERCQTSKIELFAKIVSSLQTSTVRKKAQSQMFDRVLITSPYFSSLQTQV